MNIKIHSRTFVLLALALSLLLGFSVSISYTFADEHDTDAIDKTITDNVEGGGDTSFQNTIREQKDVRRDFFSAQQETVEMLRDEQKEELQSLRDSDATIDEVRTLRNEQIDESRSLRNVQVVERQNVRDTQRDTRRATLDERRQARIEAYANRILKRMNAAIDRLYKIANRVESRIAKLEEKHDGLDLSGARDLLAIARTALDTAQPSVELGEEAVQNVLSSDTPKEAFSEVRKLLGDTKQSIKDAHKALVDAIVATKASTGEHGEKEDHVHEDDADGDTDTNGEGQENGNGEE